jgi:hypothetical protein
MTFGSTLNRHLESRNVGYERRFGRSASLTRKELGRLLGAALRAVYCYDAYGQQAGIR